jgi:hypothetical protein
MTPCTESTETASTISEIIAGQRLKSANNEPIAVGSVEDVRYPTHPPAEALGDGVASEIRVSSQAADSNAPVGAAGDRHSLPNQEAEERG